MKNNLWFKAKRYGWGWYPCSWQGVLVLIAYTIGLILIFSRIETLSNSVVDTLTQIVAPLIILTGILMEVCWKTGERPHWRWGK